MFFFFSALDTFQDLIKSKVGENSQVHESIILRFDFTLETNMISLTHRYALIPIKIRRCLANITENKTTSGDSNPSISRDMIDEAVNKAHNASDDTAWSATSCAWELVDVKTY